MSAGMTCIPTIHEEVERMQRADMLHDLETNVLVGEPRRRTNARMTSASHRAPPEHRRSHRHRLLTPLHMH